MSATTALPRLVVALAGLVGILSTGCASMASMVEHGPRPPGGVATTSSPVVVDDSPFSVEERARIAAVDPWIEQVAKSVTGRAIRLIARDGESVAALPRAPVDSAKASELRARAKAEPVVQNVLDVFGGDIESVEEVEDTK